MEAFRKQGYMRYSDFFVQLTKIQEAKEWHETECICKNVLVYLHKGREYVCTYICIHVLLQNIVMLTLN